jgi:hypothetical protein
MKASSTKSAAAGRQAYSLPDERGHFGEYGGIFVAETLSIAMRLHSWVVHRRCIWQNAGARGLVVRAFI